MDFVSFQNELYAGGLFTTAMEHDCMLQDERTYWYPVESGVNAGVYALRPYASWRKIYRKHDVSLYYFVIILFSINVILKSQWIRSIFAGRIP